MSGEASEQNAGSHRLSIASFSQSHREANGSPSAEHNRPIHGQGSPTLSRKHQAKKRLLLPAHGQENTSAGVTDNATTALSGQAGLERIMQDILAELRKLNQTQTASQAQERLKSTVESPLSPRIFVPGLYRPEDGHHASWNHSMVSRMNEYNSAVTKRLFKDRIVMDYFFEANISSRNLRICCPWDEKINARVVASFISRSQDTSSRLDQWMNVNWPNDLESLRKYSRLHQSAALSNNQDKPTIVSHNGNAPQDECLGKIWWLGSHLWEEGPYWIPYSSEAVISVDIIALLVHLYSFHRSSPSSGVVGRPASLSSAERDIVQIQGINDLRRFLISFANPSHLSAYRSWYKLQRGLWSRSNDARLHLQYHLRYFIRVKPCEQTPKPESSPGKILCLHRQEAKISNLMEGQSAHLQERVLSLSLIMFPECGTFLLVILGGDGSQILKTTPHETLSPDQPWSRVGINPWTSGKLAGPAHFLVALFLLLELWAQGWKSTLNTIDQIVSFKMADTMNHTRLAQFMFDSPDSMRLSKQYFTVLQILRIADQWIDEHVTEWEQTKHILIDKVQEAEQLFPGVYGASKPFHEQVDIVTQLLLSQVKILQERIARKTEDVKSLRDGLLNATSLREAMKGIALNRAIYVFTAVTIVYTPLGFITGLWALPILNTNSEGDNVRPSKYALIATFVIIPVLTYLGCLYMAWYYTSSGQTWQSFLRFSQKTWVALKELRTRGKISDAKSDVS